MTIAVVAASPHSGDRYLTTEEVARIMRVSPRTLERMRGNGTGPAFIKIGPGLRAPVRYRESVVYAYLNQRNYLSTTDYDVPSGMSEL